MAPESESPWPHAPLHQLADSGTYFVTVGTYLKAHHFRSRERLDVLRHSLLSMAREYGWRLEAWAVFSNHYYFVAHSPPDEEDAKSLRKMLGRLHTETGSWANQLDKTPRREVWHNYRETKLTFKKSYFARLSYVHHNAVKHGLVPVASQYRWCSAPWFEREVSPAMVKSIYRFKIDSVKVDDDFVPAIEW